MYAPVSVIRAGRALWRFLMANSSVDSTFYVTYIQGVHTVDIKHVGSLSYDHAKTVYSKRYI